MSGARRVKNVEHVVENFSANMSSSVVSFSSIFIKGNCMEKKTFLKSRNHCEMWKAD